MTNIHQPPKGIQMLTPEEGRRTAKEIFAKGVSFEVISKNRFPGMSSKNDVLICVADDVFPFTGHQPIDLAGGLRWYSQVSTLGQHIIFHMTLIDEDTTGNRKDFKLIICPHEEDSNEDIKSFVRQMENTPPGIDMNFVLLGKYQLGFYMKPHQDILRDMLSDPEPELMRHGANGNTDVSMVGLRLLTNSLHGDMARTYDPVYQDIRKICPSCLKEANSNFEK